MHGVTNSWIKTKWKKSFKCKNEVGRQHTTFTPCQNGACSNELLLWRVDYTSERKRFDWANGIFASYFLLRGHDTHSAVIVVSRRHDLPFNARAFPLTSFEMQCSSLRLNKGLRLFHFLQSASGNRIIIRGRTGRPFNSWGVAGAGAGAERVGDFWSSRIFFF